MRRAGAVALVTLTFALIRVQHASPVAFALGAEHMQSVTESGDAGLVSQVPVA